MIWQKQSADRLWYQTAFEQGNDDYRPLTAFGGAALGSGVEMEPVDWKDEAAASKHDSEAAVFLMGFALAILGFDDQGEHGEALGELIGAVKQFKDFNDDGSQRTEPSPDPPIPTGKVPIGEPVEASSKNPPRDLLEEGANIEREMQRQGILEQRKRDQRIANNLADQVSPHGPRDASRDEVQTGETELGPYGPYVAPDFPVGKCEECGATCEAVGELKSPGGGLWYCPEHYPPDEPVEKIYGIDLAKDESQTVVSGACVQCGKTNLVFDDVIFVRTDKGREACCSNECYQDWESPPGPPDPPRPEKDKPVA